MVGKLLPGHRCGAVVGAVLLCCRVAAGPCRGVVVVVGSRPYRNVHRELGGGKEWGG